MSRGCTAFWGYLQSVQTSYQRASCRSFEKNSILRVWWSFVPFKKILQLQIHTHMAVSDKFLRNLCHCLHTIQHPLEFNDCTKSSRQPNDVSMLLVPTKHQEGSLRTFISLRDQTTSELVVSGMDGFCSFWMTIDFLFTTIWDLNICANLFTSRTYNGSGHQDTKAFACHRTSLHPSNPNTLKKQIIL